MPISVRGRHLQHDEAAKIPHDNAFVSFDPGVLLLTLSFQSGAGPIVLKERTYERMDRDLLKYYGGGEAWPVAVAYDMGEVAPNGNYLESDELAVNHGVCGDTPQVISFAPRHVGSGC